MRLRLNRDSNSLFRLESKEATVVADLETRINKWKRPEREKEEEPMGEYKVLYEQAKRAGVRGSPTCPVASPPETHEKR